MDSNKLRQVLSNINSDSDVSFENYVDLLDQLFCESGKQHFINLLLDDTSDRRSLFFIIEQFILLDWERNQFKSLTHPLVYQICKTLLLIANQIHFSDGKVWFGGISHLKTYSLTCFDSKTNQNSYLSANANNIERRLNSILYFSICILMLSFIGKPNEIIPNEQIKSFFQRFESEFCSSAVLFIDALLENDERCLSTLIALLKMHYTVIEHNFQIPKILNAEILFILLLYKIQFDPVVAIDWICSEPELSYLFLKSYTYKFSQLTSKQILEVCEGIQHIPKIDEVRFDIIQNAESNSNLPKQKQFHFEIEELHGEQQVIKHIIIPTESNELISKRTMEDFPNGQTLFKNFYLFCTNLKLKLGKLADSLHFSPKHIYKNISIIEFKSSEIL